MPKPLNVCVVLNKPVVYSETFIKSHIEQLNAKVLYTSFLPYKASAEQQSPKSISKLLKVKAGAFYHFVNDKMKGLNVDRFFDKNKIEVVLAEYGIVGVVALECCKRKNIPLVVHFHGYDAYRKDILERFGNQYQNLFEYASAIIVVSRHMEQQLIKLGAPAHKIHYNVYGVDGCQFVQSNVSASSRQLLAVGRFVEKKAPYLTLLAFQKVLEQVPDATLVMAGDGPLLDACRQMVSSLALSKNVVLKGALPHTEVSGLMQNARAFVQHSLTPGSGDSEGTPNAILEAQASGLPVISTAHAGIKDVVLHEKTGYLVEEGDINTMATYMGELLKDAELAATLGKNGREHVLQNYSMKDSISRLYTILHDCVSKQAHNGNI